MAAQPSEEDSGSSGSSDEEAHSDPLEGDSSTQEKVKGEAKTAARDYKGHFTKKHAPKLLTYESEDSKNLHEMICKSIFIPFLCHQLIISS